MRKLAFSLAALLSLAGVSQGATWSPLTFDKSVAFCAWVVNGDHPEGFDAYVRVGTSRVVMFGTPEAGFQFGKCMDKGGWPIEAFKE